MAGVPRGDPAAAQAELALGTGVKWAASGWELVRESRARICAKLLGEGAGGKHRFVERKREESLLGWLPTRSFG